MCLLIHSEIFDDASEAVQKVVKIITRVECVYSMSNYRFNIQDWLFFHISFQNI